MARRKKKDEKKVEEIAAESVVDETEPVETEEPSTEDAVEVGLIPDDAEPKETEPKRELEEVPTIAEITADGLFSRRTAEAIIHAKTLMNEDIKESYQRTFTKGYRVTGNRMRGFWAAGRQFAGGETVGIPIEELSAADMLELENTDPRYLTVERIGFDDDNE